MFQEPLYTSEQNGWIEVICGSMFSGKTEELMRRIRRVQYANQPLRIFKPSLDTRYVADKIVSHDNRQSEAIIISKSKEILDHITEHIQVVAIDEVQFFDETFPLICTQLANQGVRVILAGLDMDYRGIPFGTMPTLLSQAEYITKLHAICARCGAVAQYTHRKTADQEVHVIGTSKEYQALCRKCYTNV